MDKFKLEQINDLPSNIEEMVEQGHMSDEFKAGIACDYEKFYIVIKSDKNDILGCLTAYTAFAEIYVDDLWVKPEYRGKSLGRKLLGDLEDRFKGKGFNNINLVTSSFQAPDFYKKCGFEVEFERVNKKNPKLSKTFFIKYFDDEVQHRGIIQRGSDES